MQGTSGPTTLGGGGYSAVVGGTGAFAYPQGVVNRTVRSMNRGVNIVELEIRVVCLITSAEPVSYLPLVFYYFSFTIRTHTNMSLSIKF